jgi:hypothetical protein
MRSSNLMLESAGFDDDSLVVVRFQGLSVSLGWVSRLLVDYVNVEDWINAKDPHIALPEYFMDMI